MKSYSIKLYIIYTFIFILTALGFSLAYVTITNEYVSNTACKNLEGMDMSVAVNVNRKVSADYNNFLKLVNDSKETALEEDTPTIFAEVINNKNDFSINGISEIKYGYYYNSLCYIDGNSFSITRENQYANNNFAILNYSEILTNYSDKNYYCVFRCGDIFAYFDCDEYILADIKDVSGMPDNYFIILTSDGEIVYQEDKNRINKLYNDVTTLLTDEYDELINNLDNTGYKALNFDGVKSFVVHSPLFSDLASYTNANGDKTYNAYNLLYVFNKKDAIASMNYLTVSLAVVFVTAFLIVNAGLAVILFLFVRKEQDMSSSKLRYFFAKPYVISINKKGNIKSFNRTCHESLKDLQNIKTVYDFKAYECNDELIKLVKAQKSFTIEAKNKDDNNLYIRFIPMKTSFGYALLGEDITIPLYENIRNTKIALYNSVTNLPNKLLLEKALDALIANRKNEKGTAALVAIDTVDFVKINKMFGFSAGDRLLQDTKEIILNSVDGFNTTIYNIRTSIFMILFYGAKDFNEILSWSKKITNEFGKPVEIKENYLTLAEVKMGIYNIPLNTDNLTPDSIYDCAFSALERAKSSRLIKCATYNSEFGQMLSRDQLMEQDLFKAIKEKNFIMYYQPQYNSKKGKIVGFEALVRWDNPKYRYETPEHYISLAERNGMIIDLGHIIIEETFRFAKKIEATGISISMNVSPAQLLHSGFVNEMMGYFDRFKLKRGSICIEITETFLMENSEVMIEKLRLLRDKGFSIHLDDFGIGYSSMLYLKDLPIDTIKIDKDFIKLFTSEKFSKAIVTRIVQLALGLDLSLVAEGVENEKQMQALSKIGCDVIQGYLISKPVNEDETIALIKKYNGRFTMTDSDFAFKEAMDVVNNEKIEATVVEESTSFENKEEENEEKVIENEPTEVVEENESTEENKDSIGEESVDEENESTEEIGD